MKKCFMMFVFLVVMLVIAILTETDIVIPNYDVVELRDAESHLISENSGNVKSTE